MPRRTTRPFKIRPAAEPGARGRRLSNRASGIVGIAAALVTVVTGVVALWPSADNTPRTRESAIRECIAAHGLQKGTGVVDADAAGTRVFGTCDWPPSHYTQPDGYSEVIVKEATGPGHDEASGASAADRLFSPCGEVQVAYSFGKQGGFRRQPPMTLFTGEIVTVDGIRWNGDQRNLPFYPERDESDVLHNFSSRLDYARCVG